MEEKEIIQILKAEKSTKTFGGDFDRQAKERVWKNICKQTDLFVDAPQQKYVYELKDYVSFFSWRLNESFLRPVSTGFTAFLILFGAWIFAMNVTYASIPGDVLYPVKLATERVQLQLVFNNEKRLKLQVEFADRRLQEMKEVSSSKEEDKQALVHTAAEEFRKQISSVHNSLEELQTQEPDSAVSIAKSLDEKVDEYAVVIAQSETNLSKENQEDVEGVIAAVEDTGQQAVEVIVSQQEITPKQETARDLEKIFRKDITSVESRENESIRRIHVVESVLLQSQQEDLYKERLQEMKETLASFSHKITEAMNIFAAGGYRRSFEITQEIEATLTNIETDLVSLEIDISTHQQEEQEKEQQESIDNSQEIKENIQPSPDQEQTFQESIQQE